MRVIKNNNGFTLMELITVLAIVIILVSISSVKFFAMVEKSRRAEALEVLMRMYRGYQIIEIEEETPYANDWAQLGFEENTTPQTKFFTYTYDAGAAIGTARRNIDPVNMWIQIDLSNGTITKSSQY